MTEINYIIPVKILQNQMAAGQKDFNHRMASQGPAKPEEPISAESLGPPMTTTGIQYLENENIFYTQIIHPVPTHIPPLNYQDSTHNVEQPVAHRARETFRFLFKIVPFYL